MNTNGFKYQELSPSPIEKIPQTPKLQRILDSERLSPLKTPKLSPQKLFSPIKTPRGRAGLPSPQKRTLEELNGSAVKRAYRTKISQTLDEEDTFSGDELDNQDLEIAEAIIKESQVIEHYGSEVILEDDPSGEGTGESSHEDGDTENGDIEDGESEDEVKVIMKKLINEEPKESKRKRRKPIVESDISDDEFVHSEVEISSESEDIDLSDDEFVVGSPSRKPKEFTEREVSAEKKVSIEGEVSTERKHRGRPRGSTSSPRKTSSPRVRSSPKESSPHKSSIDSSKIISIFKQDDENFTPEPRKQVSKSMEAATEVGPQILDHMVEIPIVSGVKVYDDKHINGIKFESLPVPKVVDGSIPKEYIEKYLPDIDWDASTVNDVTDDRAYFVDGTEGFFDQTSNREKHSVMSLASLGISLTHEEFTKNIEYLQYFKKEEKAQLTQLYEKLYNQWSFEISQGFNLCFYGLGSKIKSLNDFATDYLVDYMKNANDYDTQALVINGYNPSLKLKDVFPMIVKTFFPEDEYVSKSVVEGIAYLAKKLEKVETKKRLILIVNCIDAEPMRDNKVQVQLCQLASIPEISFMCTVENINFPLLWDSYQVENFQFLFHDLTTYEPYYAETSFKDSVNLGKTKRTQSSRGAKFVLSALNDNSKKLYKILLDMQLDKIKEMNPKSTYKSSRGNLRTSIEFKTYHAKCVEQFITANEISFRSMLNEFVEHNMCSLTKDEAGLERVYVGYTGEEMERLKVKSLGGS